MTIDSSTATSLTRSVARSLISGGEGETDPRFTLQPDDEYVAVSEDAVFVANHEGTEPITGVWQEYKV